MSFYALLRTMQHAAVWAGTPPAPPPSNAGQPIGLLLAITYAS